jgi:hypothetical protein
MVIDTASSIIAKNKPRARVLTTGAEWKQQRRAKKLERFLWAEFMHRDVYQLGPLIFRDGCTFGTGCLKVCALEKKIYLERVIIDEIIVDERDCISQCEPSELFQRKLVDKEKLKEMFPDHTVEIDKAGEKTHWTTYREVPMHKVIVVEAWRPGARHTIAIETGTLLDEEWSSDAGYPFVWFRWSQPITGFYGQGIAEELVGRQVKMDKLERFIERCQELIAVPRIFVDVSSKNLKPQLDRTIGAIVPYRGKPPVFMVAQAVGQEVYAERERQVEESFKQIGISQLTAQSLKPAGLESAVALREFTDIEGQRFAIVAQAYERFYLDIAWKIIEVAKELYQSGTDTRSRYVGYGHNAFVESIDWSAVDLEDDCYELDIMAASILSLTPSGRMQTVTELAQVKMIDKTEGRYLLNNPDLQRSDSVAYADFEDIERVAENLLDGKYRPPEPFQNLALGIKRINQIYLKTYNDMGDYPDEEVLDNFRTWLLQAAELQKLATPPPLPMPGGQEQPVTTPMPPDSLPGQVPAGVAPPPITEPPLGMQGGLPNG